MLLKADIYYYLLLDQFNFFLNFSSRTVDLNKLTFIKKTNLEFMPLDGNR